MSSELKLYLVEDEDREYTALVRETTPENAAARWASDWEFEGECRVFEFELGRGPLVMPWPEPIFLLVVEGEEAGKYAASKMVTTQQLERKFRR